MRGRLEGENLKDSQEVGEYQKCSAAELGMRMGR